MVASEVSAIDFSDAATSKLPLIQQVTPHARTHVHTPIVLQASITILSQF